MDMDKMTGAAVLGRNVEAAVATLQAVTGLGAAVDRAAQVVVASLKAGGKVLLCGNGGSAAEASHLAGELIGRYRQARRPYACVCLPDSPGVMTCIANDFSYNEVFARQVAALARRGDVLIVFTSSGASANIAAALEAGRTAGAASIAFLGKSGGLCKDKATVELLVPGQATARIQEAHQVLLHTLCDLVEQGMGDAAA